MRKLIFPQKNNLGDLGIYPTSPSYSLALTFIEATIFTVFACCGCVLAFTWRRRWARASRSPGAALAGGGACRGRRSPGAALARGGACRIQGGGPLFFFPSGFFTRRKQQDSTLAMYKAGRTTSTLERSRRSTWPLCALSLAIPACDASLGPSWPRAFCQLTAEGSSSCYHGNPSPSYRLLVSLLCFRGSAFSPPKSCGDRWGMNYSIGLLPSDNYLLNNLLTYDPFAPKIPAPAWCLARWRTYFPKVVAPPRVCRKRKAQTTHYIDKYLDLWADHPHNLKTPSYTYHPYMQTNFH